MNFNTLMMITMLGLNVIVATYATKTIHDWRKAALMWRAIAEKECRK